MTLTEHEATLAAARTMLLTGPFWVLDLWNALPSSVQVELVEVLAERESFRDALATHGLLEPFDARLEEWLDELGVTREEVEAFAAETLEADEQPREGVTTSAASPARAGSGERGGEDDEADHAPATDRLRGRRND
jgi:hypothetical protein